MKDFFTLRKSMLGMGLCSVLGLWAQQPIVIEAEDYIESLELDDKTFNAEGSEVSGGKAISLDRAHKGSYAAYAFEVPETGTYDLSVWYVTMNTRWMTIQVNDQVANVVKCDNFTANWSGTPGSVEVDGEPEERPGVAHSTIKVYCTKGQNFLTVKAMYGYSPEEDRDQRYAPTIDRFELTRSETEIEKPRDWDAEADRIRVECENYDAVSGNGTTTVRPPFSGQRGGKIPQGGGSLSYNVNVPEEGAYIFEVWYVTMQKRWITVKVNKQEVNYVSFLDFTDGWGDREDEKLARRQVLLYLKKGQNTITLGQYTKTGKDASEHGDSPSMDYFTLDLVKYPDLQEPENEIVMYKASLADIAKWSGTIDVTKLNDHNEYTEAKENTTTGQVTLEFPVNIYMSGYAFATENNSDEWTVETSADGEQWTTADVTSKGKNGVLTTCTASSGDTSVKYVRLNIRGNEPVAIGDFAVFGNLDGNLANAVIGAGFQDYETTHQGFDNSDWHEGIDKLFDGDPFSQFTVRSEDMGDYKDIKVTVYTPTEMSVKAYSLSTHRTGYLSRAPKNWTLEAFDYDANDGDGGYTVVDSRENMDFAVTASSLVLNVANPIVSDMYVLTLKDRAKMDTHLSDFQLYSEPFGAVTGIEDIINPADVIAVWGENGCVAISADNAARYSVCNLCGMTLASGVCSEGVTRVNLAAGLYIVNVNGRATKVLVK